jgi:arginine decarboxylase-like protein
MIKLKGPDVVVPGNKNYGDVFHVDAAFDKAGNLTLHRYYKGDETKYALDYIDIAAEDLTKLLVAIAKKTAQKAKKAKK